MTYQNIPGDNWHSYGFAAIDSGTGRNRHTVLSGDIAFLSQNGMKVGIQVVSNPLVLALAFGYDSNGNSVDHRRIFEESSQDLWDLTGKPNGNHYLYVNSWGSFSSSTLDFETTTNLNTAGVVAGQLRLFVPEMRIYQFVSGAWQKLDYSIIQVGVVVITAGVISNLVPAGVGIELSLDDPGNLYAAAGHDHYTDLDTRYADIDHGHTPESVGINSNTFKPDYDLLYAQIAHTHDYSSLFAPTSHNHAELYSPVGHQHDTRYDARYSPLGHLHTGVYSLSGHNHVGDYAALSHTHTGFSLSSHVHTGIYAEAVHTHNYAAVSHDHTGVYALVAHEVIHHASFDVRYLLRDEYVEGGGGEVSSVDGRAGAVTLSDLYQAKDIDLTAIAALTGTGYLERIGDGGWQLGTPSGGGSGTVTSVGVSAPTEFVISGSPVTTSGTIAITWGSSTQSLVLATPSASSGVPSLRSLVSDDIPTLAIAKISGLQGALDGKSATSHDHTGTYQPLSTDLTEIVGLAGNGYLKFDGVNWVFDAGSGGAVEFTSLSDAPSSYTGQAGKIVAVKGTEDGVEFITVGGTGTVTSVALSLPAIFSVTGSPITTTGTLTASLASQSANLVWAAPDAIGGAPVFRSLVSDDIPTLAIAKTSGLQTALDGKSATSHNHDGVYQPVDGDLSAIAALSGTGHLVRTGADSWELQASGSGSVTSVDLSLPAEFSISGNPVTSIGTLTGAWANQAQGKVLASPTGSTGTPTFRSLAATDLPNISANSITSDTIATARLGSGTANNATFLRGDQTWQSVGSLATVQTASPTATTNAALGTLIFSTNTGKFYICVDATTNQNDWKVFTSSGDVGIVTRAYPGGTLTNDVGADTAPNKVIADADILWYIGTNQLTSSFTNPVDGVRILQTNSGLFGGSYGSPVVLADRILNSGTSFNYLSSNLAQSWFRFNFGTNTRIVLTRVAIQQRGDANSSLFRTLSIRYSTDGTNFTQAVSTTASNSQGDWHVFDVTGFLESQHLEVRHTSASSSADNYFVASEILLYGNIVYV